jgi:hypothetical protein
VHYTLTCDGNDDCGDDSDKSLCNLVNVWLGNHTDSGINVTMFVCPESGEVVGGDKRCDGDPHCMDGSDEQGCDTCQSGKRAWKVSASQSVCFPDRWRCPKNKDIDIFVDVETPYGYEYNQDHQLEYTVLRKDLRYLAVHMDGVGGLI